MRQESGSPTCVPVAFEAVDGPPPSTSSQWHSSMRWPAALALPASKTPQLPKLEPGA